MLDPVRRTILYDKNAAYYGYPMEKLMERAGEGIARALIKKYGPRQRVGFFCGPGNNGGDGFAAARHLLNGGEVEVYLVSGARHIHTSESRKNWRLFRGPKYDNVKPRDIPDNFDVVVECLFGTGVRGEPRKPYPEIIKKLNTMQGHKVTIDLPAPGFRSEFNISMMFAKEPQAEVIDIGYPRELVGRIGVGEVKALSKPEADSHKRDNGTLLIIGGSRQYHGALLLAAQIASKIVDLVYVATTTENHELIKKLKGRSADFIAVSPNEIIRYAGQVDTVLVGPGLGENGDSERIINSLLKKFPKKKFVLDADALKVADKRLLNKNVIITPHCKEFEILFGRSGSKTAARAMAKKYGCTVVLKGRVDFVCSKDECKYNDNGNPGMTKGGTGDILAGLIAAWYTTNEPFLAAAAGVFLNGLAGDRLAKRVGRYYSASDLLRELPRTIKWCEDY